MTDPMPHDPVSPLLEVALSQFAMYLAYQEAGFSKEEAFELVKVALATMWNNAHNANREADHDHD